MLHILALVVPCLLLNYPFYLQDPCRPEVKEAVELCKKAGVKVCMCVAFMPIGAWRLLERIQAVFVSENKCAVISCEIFYH